MRQFSIPHTAPHGSPYIPPMCYDSFTSTWLAFFNGELSDYMLKSAVAVLFNCEREHVFPAGTKDTTLPLEVSWVDGCDNARMRKECPTHASADHNRKCGSPCRIVRDSIPKEIAGKFDEFQAILRQLDEDGRVFYRWQETTLSDRANLRYLNGSEKRMRLLKDPLVNPNANLWPISED